MFPATTVVILLSLVPAYSLFPIFGRVNQFGGAPARFPFGVHRGLPHDVYMHHGPMMMMAPWLVGPRLTPDHIEFFNTISLLSSGYKADKGKGNDGKKHNVKKYNEIKHNYYDGNKNDKPTYEENKHKYDGGYGKDSAYKSDKHDYDIKKYNAKNRGGDHYGYKQDYHPKGDYYRGSNYKGVEHDSKNKYVYGYGDNDNYHGDSKVKSDGKYDSSYKDKQTDKYKKYRVNEGKDSSYSGDYHGNGYDYKVNKEGVVDRYIYDSDKADYPKKYKQVDKYNHGVHHYGDHKHGYGPPGQGGHHDQHLKLFHNVHWRPQHH